MKSAKTVRECRIIKNGNLIFEGSDEDCLAFLAQLKNSIIFRSRAANPARLITWNKSRERMLPQ